MGKDQAKAPAKLVIDKALAEVPHHQEDGTVDWGFFDRGEHAVDKALRTDPLLAEAGLTELLARQHVVEHIVSFKVEKHHGRKYRIYFEICFAILFRKMLFMPGHEMHVDGLRDGALRGEARGATAEKIANAGEGVGPQRAVERGVVNVADQQR